jgi:hypothetical protein
MAFVRQIGNSFYLVHNVRRGGKVKQLHLARLGNRPRITDEVVRNVSRKHPLLDVDWNQLRETVNSRIELFDPRSPYIRKLKDSMLSLNLDLADFSPVALEFSGAPQERQEIITQLRLLRSTVEVKLRQFDEKPHAGLLVDRGYRS